MWSTTLRYPSTQDSSAVSRNDLVAQQLDNSRLSIRDRLYTLFTSYSEYANFSNEAWYPNDGNSYDSLESVHDQIHGLVGSGGHMSYIDVAAMDPIFYLHHTNVDRAFAIWQALYPDSFVVPTASKYGTYTTSPGDIEDSQTRLTPFHTDSTGDFWTSDSSRSTGAFGYTYPELPFWTANNDPDAYQASIRSKINDLYGSTAPATITKRSPKAHGLSERESPVDPTEQSTPQNLTVPSKPDVYREWIANMRVQKFALSGSFFVHIFLGDFNPDPAQWSFDPNLVGTHCFFTASKDCIKCRNLGSLQVSGSIPMTTALLAAIEGGKLKSLEPVDVEPFLKKELHWRITLVSLSIPPDFRVRC
jgi:tyrosinase